MVCEDRVNAGSVREDGSASTLISKVCERLGAPGLWILNGIDNQPDIRQRDDEFALAVSIPSAKPASASVPPTNPGLCVILVPFMSYLRFLAACLLLSAAAHAQSDLPPAPAPAAPAKPDFTLPAKTPYTVIKSSGPAPETPIEELVCDAAATGIYAPSPTKFTPAQETALRDYMYLVKQQISAEWVRHIPASANNVWMKGRTVEVRFAIMPDGSYDPPIVTVSSGRSSWDAGAIAAINNYASFPTLPAGINHPAIMCIRFGYNSDGSLFRPTTPKLWQPDNKPVPQSKPPVINP